MATTPAQEQARDRISDIGSNAYQTKEYQQKKGDALGVIGKSNFLDALSKNAGMINSTLATIVITAIVIGSSISVPLIVGLIGATLGLAGLSAYASYMNEKMSKEAGYGFDEQRMVAATRVGAAANIEVAKENAHELAGALKETLGEELKETRKDACHTQAALVETQQTLAKTNAAVASLQKQIMTWQEREAAKVPAEKSVS